LRGIPTRLVKAIKTAGPNKSNLVISNNDAATLLGMKENLSFLEKARVLGILD
jgi:malate/lactate dehydrogenase